MVGKVFKYVLALSVLFALLTLPLGAVTTGATITDAAGNPYSYGTYRFEFVAGPGPVAVGTGESTTTRTGVLNASGAFSGVVLGDTSRLGGGCRWKATICSTTGACYSLFINVTAADTSLSTVLSAAAPLLSGTAAGLTFGAATGAGTDMYTLTDSASNTGTGNVLKLATASGSAAKGLTVGCGAQASAASPANGTVCATLTGGAGGASSAALTAGGIGGTITATTGAGGANTAGAGGGTGGAGGVLTLASGVGGAASIGAATGGAGGAIAMTAGTGGGTITGGAGGAVAIAGGAGGNGSTAGGSGGALTVGSGAAGTGGTGTAGAVSLKQGASTILGVATTGAITMASPGAALSPEFLYTAKAQAASPANTQFSVIDTTGNTSTGPLFNVNTVGTSTALPVRFTAGGTANGVSMSSAGILSPIGTGKIAARWSDLGAPGANSTIAHSTYTTGFTWGDTTTNVPLTMTFGAVTAVSTANQFAILDTTASATTGALVNINTVGTSTALPLRVTAKGTANGIQVGIDGIVAKLGTGGVNTTSLQGQVAVANGGTGLASGTSGGVLAYTAAGTLASSAALAANQLVLGGGAGVVPATLGSLGTTTTLLHGNAAGAPTFAAVDVTADITGVTPVANGGTGLAAGTSGGVLGYTAAGTLASSGALTANAVVLGGGAGATPKVAAGFTTDGTSILSLGVAGASTGAISVSGATSGTVTIQPQSAAGTFNFNLPTSAGTAGQPLLSGGGVAAPHTYGTLGVAAGGTGLTAGTSGGIPYYSAADAITSSAALTAGQFVLGGGAGAAPATTFSVVPVANGGTGIAAGTSGGILGYTGAGVIASSGALTAGQFVLGGGAGVLPSTTFSVVPVANGGTNLAAGTSGGVLAYTAAGVLASSAALTQHALVIGGGAGAVPATPVGLGTATTLLHGAAAGDPTWAAVDMAADITGITPVANGGTGLAAGTSGGILGYTAAGVLASSAALTANGVVLGGGAGAVPTVTAAGAANTVLNVGAGGGAPAFNSVTVADGVYVVGPEACSLSLTTGAYAAGPAVAGALTAPYFRRTAIGNRVLELTTTAAANVTYLVCDITPPSRLTAGKGVTLDEVSYLFGFQTTQPTSIGTAAVNSITYAAPASAGGTVAAAGGVLTVTGPNHAGAAVVTGDGQCYNEELSFGTPIVLNTDYRRITVENNINQAAAAATIVQVCGAIVHYTETIL